MNIDIDASWFLLRIFVWSGQNKEIEIPLSSVRLRRPNYPYNCWTLDLSDNQNISDDGVKQIFFGFHKLPNTSVEVLVQDKGLSCSREIKNNIFYFSGKKLKLDNLGIIGNRTKSKNVTAFRLSFVFYFYSVKTVRQSCSWLWLLFS